MAAAEFIVRLVDQLSGPAKVAEAAIKRLKDAAQAAGKGSDAVKRMGDDIRRVQTMANDARIQLEKMHQAGQRVGQGMRSMASGAVTAGILGLTYQATKYGAALGFVRTQLLSTQVEFENFQATLETMSRSKEKAKVLMDWAPDFAVKTPYELDQVVGALAKLSAYGVVDPKKVYEIQGKARIERVMTSLGDASSSLNKPYIQGVEAIADAMTGQFERLKEAYGIMGSKKGDKVTLEWLDLVEDKTKNITLDLKNREKIVYEIVKILEKNYGGGMLKKSQTAGGMLSNYADAWTRFKQMIISSGLGDEVNRQLKSGLDFLEELSKPYRVKGPDNMWETRSKLLDMAAQFSGVLQNRLKETIELGKDLYQTLKRLVEILDQFANSQIGQAIGGWNGMIKGLLAIPFIKPVMEIARGFWDVVGGMAAAGVQGLVLWKILKSIRALTPGGPALAGGAAGTGGAAAGGAAAVAAGGSIGARFPWMRAFGNLGIMAWLASTMPSGTPEQVTEQIRKNWEHSDKLDAWLYGLMPSWLQKRMTPPGGAPGAAPASPADKAAEAADIRSQIAALQVKVNEIRARSKMPEMADVIARPIETQILDLQSRLKAYEDESAKTGAAVRENLDVTATPIVDTHSLDSAIAKAREFRSYMQSIGTVSPSAAPAGGGGAAGTVPGPQSRGGGGSNVNVSITLNGGGTSEATARRVAQAVREAVSRTFGDGYQKSTMVG